VPKLLTRPDFAQLRRQAKDLQRLARAGDPSAQQRIDGFPPTLALAQLRIARDYGFASWARLKSEMERREILDSGDVGGLRALIAEQPDLAVAEMENWRDHQDSAAPLSYVAMLRYDTAGSRWRDVPGTAELANLLLTAGAPVDGNPGDDETPLITAASYGDAEVARVLIAAGASIEARSSDDAGGVPNATALRHAAVFGMTDVLDVLLAAARRSEASPRPPQPAT